MYQNYERYTLTLDAAKIFYWYDPDNQRAHVRIGGQHFQANATHGNREAVARGLVAKHLIQPRDEE